MHSKATQLGHSYELMGQKLWPMIDDDALAPAENSVGGAYLVINRVEFDMFFLDHCADRWPLNV